MNSRPERLGDQLRSELCSLLQRSVRDPSLRSVMITYVRMSKDLQNARVYYRTTFNKDIDERAVKRGLQRATPFLRGQIAKRVRLRRTPELNFVYDESPEREERIAQVLEQLELGASTNSTRTDEDATNADDVTKS